MEEISSEKGY